MKKRRESMIQVIFKNLERSEMAKRLAEERISELIERFPELKKSRIAVTLSMDNSPNQSGPDFFGVKVRVLGGRLGGVILEKSANSLYVALAEVIERLLERLNRFGDRQRVVSRQIERKFTAN